MPVFEYQARDRSGGVVSGAVTAESEQMAVAQLHEAGYFVTNMAERPAPSEAAPSPAVRDVVFRPVSTGDMAVAYRELATMINSGMTIVRSLDVLEQNTRNPRLRQALRRMQRGVQTGRPLSEQMMEHPAIFSEIAVALMQAGEKSGRLDDMLKQLAEYTEYQLEVEALIRRETLYPKIVAAVIVLVLIFLPLVNQIVHGGPWLWTAIAELMLVGVLVAGLMLLPRIVLSSEYARATWDSIKLSLPIFGPIASRLALSRFSRALAALYEAGISPASALAPAGRASGNRAIAAAMHRVVPMLQGGRPLTEALAYTGMMSRTVMEMVRTGEESGELGSLLEKVAEYHEDEAKTGIHRVAVSILPIFLLIAGLIVLAIAVNFYVGMAGSILGM
ncbi:MAG: type II secretion system F family protein [Armatimonadota bacterium]